MNRISKINYVVFSYALLTSVPLDLDLPRSHVSSKRVELAESP